MCRDLIYKKRHKQKGKNSKERDVKNNHCSQKDMVEREKLPVREKIMRKIKCSCSERTTGVWGIYKVTQGIKEGSVEGHRGRNS